MAYADQAPNKQDAVDADETSKLRAIIQDAVDADEMSRLGAIIDADVMSRLRALVNDNFEEHRGRIEKSSKVTVTARLSSQVKVVQAKEFTVVVPGGSEVDKEVVAPHSSAQSVLSSPPSQLRFLKFLRGMSLQFVLMLHSTFGPRRGEVSPRVTRPPGTRFLAVADFLYSPKTVELTFKAIVADWQSEYFESLKQGRHLKAKWISVRYMVKFLTAMGLSKVLSFIRSLLTAGR